MARSEDRSFQRIFCLFLLLLLAGCSRAADPSPQTAQNDSSPNTDLFTDTNIVRIRITIPESGMNILRRTSWGPHGGGEKKPSARAIVTEGGRTYSNVAIQLKGAAGSFRSVDERPGLTLNFDKHVKGQTFHGLEKISLNNSIQDRSYIAEKISRELFAKAGIPVPRSDYAVVTLNGRPLGLYVLVEGYNKQFLQRHFKNVKGNLYDGGFCQEVTDYLNVNSGDNEEDQSDLAALVKAASSARQKNRLSELEPVLDVDRFITMIAMEILLCHWDGYAMNRNNYRVFSDKGSGKMVFMPHGLDQMFGIGGMGSPHTPIQPHMNGLIARTVMGTSEGRSRYFKKLAELRTNILDVAAVTERVREIEARIQPVLGELRRGSAASHKMMVNQMCENIAIRAENLDQQLRVPTRELKFDQHQTAVIEGWAPRKIQTNARFEALKGPDGSALLYIKADEGRTSASWRTRVALAEGVYRFEGRARTKDGSAAVLRISGAREVRPVQAEEGWTKCEYDFEIQESIADVELICELRGNSGAVWFDAGSLKITRLQ